jgi:type VI secretion system protein ImpB
MAKEGSIAPKERVNIRYETETGGVKEQIELPLRLLVLGDFTGRENPVPLEQRPDINIDKNNFHDVLEKQEVVADFQVDNLLSGTPGDKLAVKMAVKHLNDFGPDAVAEKVPQLAELLAIRRALVELRGPLSQNKEFRKQLQALLSDEGQCKSVLDEMEVGPAPAKA